jgi:hypothetical protein
MGRTGKQMRRRHGLLGTRTSLLDGGVAPGFSRPGTGRLGRALAEARKEKSVAPKKKKRSSAKALARWQDEGGRTTPRSARAPTKAVVAQKTATKKKRKRGPPELIPHPVSRPDSARLGRAKAAAKLSRIKRSGLDSRVRGHVSAKGKRAQARRDSKNS